MISMHARKDLRPSARSYVAGPLIVEHLDAMILKLTTLKQSNNTANQKVPEKLNDAAMKLVAKVDAKSEKQFRIDLNKLGTTMASKQQEIKGVPQYCQN